MKLEEIMKPYFEKQEEIQNKYTVQKNFIKMRLERLRDNKEKEISEYVENSVSSNRNFYAGYGALVKTDLEQAYARKEEELEKELNQVDKYYRVDIRELVHIKESIRKDLFVNRKELELKLREVQIESDLVMLELAKFKPEYDENYNIINGQDRKKLFDRSHELVEVKYNIEKELTKIDEYLTLTQITAEEGKVLMMSMTPWEKEEYDRRKTAREAVEVEAIDSSEPEITEEIRVEEEPKIIEENQENKGDIDLEITEEIDNESPVEEDLEEDEELVPLMPVEEDEYVDDNTLVANSFADLINVVYSDVLTSAKKLRALRVDGQDDKFLTTRDSGDEDYKYAGDLEEVTLPNGSYLSKRDISKALDNYRKQNKGRVFKVKGYNQEFEITRKTIKKVKKALNDCSIVKLLREKKLGFFDIKRVYGKSKAEDYSKEVEMGKVKTDMPTGDYINVKDFAYALKDLFAEKGPSWLDRFKQKLTRKKTELDFYMLEEESKKTR